MHKALVEKEKAASKRTNERTRYSIYIIFGACTIRLTSFFVADVKLPSPSRMIDYYHQFDVEIDVVEISCYLLFYYWLYHEWNYYFDVYLLRVLA